MGVLVLAIPGLAVVVPELELAVLLLNVLSPSPPLRVLDEALVLAAEAAVTVALVLLLVGARRPLTPTTHTRSAAANIPAANRQPRNANHVPHQHEAMCATQQGTRTRTQQMLLVEWPRAHAQPVLMNYELIAFGDVLVLIRRAATAASKRDYA